MKKCTSIGGQALIEGIMMKGPKKTVMGVRTPDGSIDLEELKFGSVKKRFPILGWPVIRGAVNLIESMVQGYKALMLSADKSGLTDLEEAEKQEKQKKNQKKIKDQTSAEKGGSFPAGLADGAAGGVQSAGAAFYDSSALTDDAALDNGAVLADGAESAQADFHGNEAAGGPIKSEYDDTANAKCADSGNVDCAACGAQTGADAVYARPLQDDDAEHSGLEKDLPAQSDSKNEVFGTNDTAQQGQSAQSAQTEPQDGAQNVLDSARSDDGEQSVKSGGIDGAGTSAGTEGAAVGAGKASGGADDKKQGAFMTALLVFASILGVALAIVLFMYLPAQIFNWTNAAAGGKMDGWRALFEGVLKIALFIAYIAVVSMAKDIKRVFMYHGAEHKSIFCYESGLPLTVENVKKQSRFHPRCGTSFMIVMLVVGILISFLIQTIFPAVTNILWLWVAIKILILPIICGFGYELIKFCGRHNNWFTRIISAPGLWMQRLTTKEPDDGMCEVAIAALTAVIPDDGSDCI